MAVLHPTAQAAGQLISRLVAQMINKFIHEQQLEDGPPREAPCWPPGEADVGGGAKTSHLICLIYIRNVQQEIMVKQVADSELSVFILTYYFTFVNVDGKFQRKPLRR